MSLAVGWPFIYETTSVLINIGYNGKLTETGELTIPGGWQSIISLGKQNISAPKLVEILRFLASFGLHFNGINLDTKKLYFTKTDITKISYPNGPIMLTGLKVMAVAHNELSSKNDYYVFQRCDYRILINETLDATALLKEYIRTLPAEVQDFILNLHQHQLSAGVICKMKMHYFTVIFSYTYKSNQIWDFMPSPDGCAIFTKAKNISKYADDIKNFSPVLQKKIVQGYGCEKKRFGAPCEKGCHGFRFNLDNSILEISRDIEALLEKEVSCVHNK